MIRNSPTMKTKIIGNGEKDSENAISKSKQKVQGKKRKRCTSESSGEYEDVLPENTLEIEKNLHASAVKNNLDDISVRKILKKVVTNDHVLALVKLREEEEDSGPDENSHCPKLTRAKARELKKVSPCATPWNLENLELTPIKHIPVKTRPEVKALIAQELPEDEDDEEYEPTHDDLHSDDDQTLESSSDLESQPRTPATPQDRTVSPKVVQDGPFKVPQNVTAQARRKLNLEEEATIARRTRSKLSLSSTPIEHIESTFVPPDELPLPDVDDLWNQFLSECLDPASTTRHEEDDEADPEYNVAADQDAHDEDEESLGNSLIKISKKELNDLVTELFNIMPEPTTEVTNGQKQSGHGVTSRWVGKQEPPEQGTGEKMPDSIALKSQSYSEVSIGKGEPKDQPETPGKQVQRNPGVEKPAEKATAASDEGKEKIAVPTVLTIVVEERDDPGKDMPDWMQRYIKPAEEVEQVVEIKVDGTTILPEQVQILQQQLRQHIQLATSNYLQLYIHPVHWTMAPTFKEYLDSFVKITEKNPKSVVDVCNLKPAWELILSWEKTVAANTPENTAMVEFILKETEKCRRRIACNNVYAGEFHDTFKEVVANSPVFLYPYLLPAMPYRAEHIRRYAYTRSEDELLALGLEQFWIYVEMNPELFPPKNHLRHRWGLIETAGLVQKYMFPWVTKKCILSHISAVRRLQDKDNPINKLFATREVKPVEHKMLPYNPRMTLYEHPEHEVPKIWLRYLSKRSQRFKQYYYGRKYNTAIEPVGVSINVGSIAQTTQKEPLPIHFTQQFKSYRQNVKHAESTPETPDRYDVDIRNAVSVSTEVPQPIVLRPVTTSQPESMDSYRVPYKAIQTASGGLLIPVAPLTPVNSNKTPIMTPAETPSKAVPNILPDANVSGKLPERSTDGKLGNESHCKCCIALRKITKRQTKISEYFKPKSGVMRKDCFCHEVKDPRISNKLRLFLTHYQDKLMANVQLLTNKLSMIRTNSVAKDIETYDNATDYECASRFQQRLLSRVGTSQFTRIKQRVHSLFRVFNVDADDPVKLAQNFDRIVTADMVDVYNEFLMLLTPAQAERVGQFREYFRRACVDRLVSKIEELVLDVKAREAMFIQLNKVFFDNVSGSCEICCDLLDKMTSHPRLAEYTFSLFPHRRKETLSATPPKLPSPEPSITKETEVQTQESKPPSPKVVSLNNIIPVIKRTMNVGSFVEDPNQYYLDEPGGDSYDTQLCIDEEASMESEPDDDVKNPTDLPSNVEDSHTDDSTMVVNETIIKTEVEHTETEVQHIPLIITYPQLEDKCEVSNSPMCTVYDDETIKPEVCEWTREEDKLILEVLKDQLTPAERKDMTIVESLEEKNVFQMLSDSLVNKCLGDVRNRVLYLVRLLVLTEK